MAPPGPLPCRLPLRRLFLAALAALHVAGHAAGLNASTNDSETPNRTAANSTTAGAGATPAPAVAAPCADRPEGSGLMGKACADVAEYCHGTPFSAQLATNCKRTCGACPTAAPTSAPSRDPTAAAPSATRSPTPPSKRKTRPCAKNQCCVDDVEEYISLCEAVRAACLGPQITNVRARPAAPPTYADLALCRRGTNLLRRAAHAALCRVSCAAQRRVHIVTNILISWTGCAPLSPARAPRTSCPTAHRRPLRLPALPLVPRHGRRSRLYACSAEH